MSGKISKTELREEIERLERKANHSKMYSENDRYPQASRDRFKKRYQEQKEQIGILNRQLTKAIESNEGDDEAQDQVEYSPSDIEEIDFSESVNAQKALKEMYPEGLDD